KEQIPATRAPGTGSLRARRRLPIALVGNALMRIASGASGVLVGVYLAEPANRVHILVPRSSALWAQYRSRRAGRGLPMGTLSDAIAERKRIAQAAGTAIGRATGIRDHPCGEGVRRLTGFSAFSHDTRDR